MSDQGAPEPHHSPPPPPPSLTPPPPPFPGAMPPPPGYAAYGVAGGVTKRIGGVAKAFVVIEAVAVALTLISLALQSSLGGPAQDYLDGVISKTAFEDEARAYTAVASLSSLVSIAALVLGIIWSFRIAKNLRQFGRIITWKPGLTIVVWILGPCTLGIINFFMLREHWKASDPDVQPGDPSWQQREAPPLISVWLALTIASIAIQVAVGVATGARAINGLSSTDSARSLAETVANDLPLALAGGLVGAAGTVVLIAIIRQLTQRHTRTTLEA